MCVDTSRVQFALSDKRSTKFSTSYSIKRVVKAFFKKYKVTSASRQDSLESLESLDNLRNSQVESYSTEIEDNEANEKLLANYEYGDDSEADQKCESPIPVHCVATDHGTFFWTTASHCVDKDLVQPLHCRSERQLGESQHCERWAQA